MDPLTRDKENQSVVTIQPIQPMAPTQPIEQDPGKTMGIIGLILAFVGVQLIGLILSIIAYRKSAKAGFKNSIAIVGIIANSILMLVGLGVITLVVLLATAGLQTASAINKQCDELGVGIHQNVAVKGNTGTLTCSADGSIDFTSPNLNFNIGS